MIMPTLDSIRLEQVEITQMLVLEPGKARALKNGQVVTLSAAEVAILLRLYRAKGHLVLVSHLESAVYEQSGCEDDICEIKYHIRNLRRKFGDNDRSLIYCRRHLGYGLEVSRVHWVD
ncbi:MAG: winged helix-turn-helix domain-containing protein [Methylocystaceae bacterium]